MSALLPRTVQASGHRIRTQLPFRTTSKVSTALHARLRAPRSEVTVQKEARDEVAEVRANVTRRIKQLGEEGRAKDAIRELAGLATIGIQPDAQAATTLLAACIQSKQPALAQSVFDELFGDFLQPDEVTFAVLLRGHGTSSPPDWSAIDSTLTQMAVGHSIELTAVTFNVLLEICVRTKDLDRGMDIIDRMEQEGAEPDEITFDIVQPRRVLRSYLKKKFGG